MLVAHCHEKRAMRPSMRGKAVATRLQRFGGDAPMSRYERAEGLEVAAATEDPVRRCKVDARKERRLPWLAAMRLEVAARESSFLWRRTDDEHSRCVLWRSECSAEVLFCGHYGLGKCTDETSAYSHNAMAPAAATSGVRPSDRDGFGTSGVVLLGPLLPCCRRILSRNGFGGVGRNNPPTFSVCTNQARNHAVSVRRFISGRTRPASRGLLPAPRLLVVRDWPDSQREGS